MILKKLISLIVISVFALSLLCACGSSGGSETTDTPETTTPAATEAQKEPLDSSRIVEIITDDMGLSLALIDDIHVSLMDADDNFTVTFTANGKNCTYVINGYTGEIVSKDIPEGAKDNAASDPFEAAIKAGTRSIMTAFHDLNGQP